MLAILRQRSFGLLWTAGLISYTGDWVLLTVLPVVVYERTHSTLASGMVLMYAAAPLLMGSIAGIAIGSGLGDVVGIVPLYSGSQISWPVVGAMRAQSWKDFVGLSAEFIPARCRRQVTMCQLV